MGRPTIYSEGLGLEICHRLAEGESLKTICKDSTMPCRSVVLGWAIDPTHHFSGIYERARDIQADVNADELIDLSDECDAESKGSVFKARLQIDTRKWVASKLKPRKYGDRIIQDVNLNPENPAEKARRDAIAALKDSESMKAIETVREKLESKSP